MSTPLSIKFDMAAQGRVSLDYTPQSFSASLSATTYDMKTSPSLDHTAENTM